VRTRGQLCANARSALCEREVSRGNERRVDRATKIAHFPNRRDLDGFDFAAQPALDKAQIREGYSVWFTAAPALVANRARAHGDGRLEERLGF
jgi:hypothetical protein